MSNEKANEGTAQYHPPVAHLLGIGSLENELSITREKRPKRGWIDYVGRFNLTDEHVPDLIRMACDPALNNADSDTPLVWAPSHAWRALGQLKATIAVRPLLDFANTSDDDWLFSDLPKVFQMMGPPAIPALSAFLEEPNNRDWATISAVNGIKEIAKDHPECRDEAIAIAVKHLGRYADNPDILNAYFIWFLMDFGQRDHIELIREAFRSGRVDISLAGDLEDIEMELGLRSKRDTPRPELFPWMDPNLKAAVKALVEQPSSASQASRRLQQPKASASRAATQPHRHVGRNDPCPCGSGKKYKKCCLQ